MLEVTISMHGMPCIEIQNPAPRIREILRREVLARWPITDPRYEIHRKAGPFLQGDQEDWILVEFWQGGYQPFVDRLNEQIEEGQ